MTHRPLDHRREHRPRAGPGRCRRVRARRLHRLAAVLPEPGTQPLRRPRLQPDPRPRREPPGPVALPAALPAGGRRGRGGRGGGAGPGRRHHPLGLHRLGGGRPEGGRPLLRPAGDALDQVPTTTYSVHETYAEYEVPGRGGRLPADPPRADRGPLRARPASPRTSPPRSRPTWRRWTSTRTTPGAPAVPDPDGQPDPHPGRHPLVRARGDLAEGARQLPLHRVLAPPRRGARARRRSPAWGPRCSATTRGRRSSPRAGSSRTPPSSCGRSRPPGPSHPPTPTSWGPRGRRRAGGRRCDRGALSPLFTPARGAIPRTPASG